MARYIVATGGYPVAYKQNVDTGINFTGLQPTEEFDPASADVGVMGQGTWIVPVDTTNNRAGLWTFNHTFPFQITQVQLELDAGITSWTLSVVRKDGSDFTVASGTTPGDIYLAEQEDNLPLLMPGDKPKLVTVGPAVGASAATIFGQYRNR